MNRKLKVAVGSLALLLATSVAGAQEDEKKKAVSVTTAPALQAPGAARAVEEVFFQIRTPGTGEQLAFLRPGETLNLRVGTDIELFAVARPQGGRDRDLYRPETRFSLSAEDRDEVQILEVEEKRGEVTLRALAVDPQRRQDATLEWRILENIQGAAALKSGSIAIDILPASDAPPVSSQPGAALGEREARALWTNLYRGILMREPDTFTGVARLQSDGYPALLDLARDIAESDESAIRIYSRGVCNEQRLLSLYRHLWGMSESQIPRAQWDRNLDLMQDRRFDDVVVAFLESDEFLEHHKLERSAAFTRRYGD